MTSATPSHCWLWSCISMHPQHDDATADARRAPAGEINRAIALLGIVDHDEKLGLVTGFVAAALARHGDYSGAECCHGGAPSHKTAAQSQIRPVECRVCRGRSRARTKPTMSLTAFMVSPASFCARAEPSARMASMVTGSCISRFISRADRAELGDGQIDQRRLEGRELRVAEFAEHAGAGCAGERRIDADQIVGLGPRFQARLLARQRLRIGLGLADFLRDGVGIVGEIDARIVGGVRLRHFLGAVAQRHDASRLAGDQRLRQREEGVADSRARGSSGRSRC